MGTPIRLELQTTVLDTEDVKGLAGFYHELLGWEYTTGPDDDGATEWATIASSRGIRLSFQRVDTLEPPRWPDPSRPQQIHLDFVVPTVEDLKELHGRVLELGAELLLDQSDDPDESLYIYADPAGHPFCIFVPENTDLFKD